MTNPMHQNWHQRLVVHTIALVVCLGAAAAATGADEGSRTLSLRFEVSGGVFRLRNARVFAVKAPPTLHTFGSYGLTVQLRDGKGKTLSEHHIWDPRRVRSAGVTGAGERAQGGVTAPTDTTFELSVPLSCDLRSVKFVEANAVVDVSAAVAEACGKKRAEK